MCVSLLKSDPSASPERNDNERRNQHRKNQWDDTVAEVSRCHMTMGCCDWTLQFEATVLWYRHKANDRTPLWHHHATRMWHQTLIAPLLKWQFPLIREFYSRPHAFKLDGWRNKHFDEIFWGCKLQIKARQWWAFFFFWYAG